MHGIGGNKSNWNQQLASVAPYVQSEALDLRGYGESTLGAIQSNIDEYCDDILCVADRLGALNVILCGLSYGSWIATSSMRTYMVAPRIFSVSPLKVISPSTNLLPTLLGVGPGVEVGEAELSPEHASPMNKINVIIMVGYFIICSFGV